MQAIGPNQEKWLQALESGTYLQTADWLTDNGCYCCLGVGCVIFKIPSRMVEDSDGNLRKGFGIVSSTGDAPNELLNLLALRDGAGKFAKDNRLVCRGQTFPFLTSANDAGVSFVEIAAFCRTHPESVFTEPR